MYTGSVGLQWQSNRKHRFRELHWKVENVEKNNRSNLDEP